jgi:hypothetical protein
MIYEREERTERVGNRLCCFGRSFSAVIVTILALLLFSISTSAQRSTGTLRGQILDPQGAAVSDADVTVTNQDTGVEIRVKTTSAGTYALPALLPGLYKVTVDVKGFRTFVKTDVDVAANQDNVADARLDLGAAAEIVEVKASAGGTEIQTTSSSLNNTYDSQFVQLPNSSGTLNGSVLNLAVLAPNTVAQPGGVTGIGGSIGGTRPRENNFVVDGVDDNNLGVTGPNSTVIPDAVQEFNLTTNQFSAEYGHSAGGQFALVTKTGTNNWHGMAYEYNQNKNYNSIDNLTKSAINDGLIPGKPAYDNNRAGGNVGGPIIKNKLFVFGAYEFTYLHGQGTPTALTAPTAEGLATLNSLAANGTIRSILNNFPVAPQAFSSQSDWIPVRGELIPIGNLTIISPTYQKENDIIANADYSWRNHQFGARFLFNNATFIFPVNSTQVAFNQDEPVRNRKIALTDVWSINPHMVNDLRLQYSYFSQQFTNPCGDACPPDVAMADLGGYTIGPADFQSQKQNTYQIADTVSWLRGKHSFKFGAQYNHFIYPQFFLPRSFGDNQYDTTEQFINDVVGIVPNTLRNAGTGSFLGTQSAFYFFGQDDYKLTPKLTLNLGLRYEYWTNPLGASTQTLNAISNVPGVITFGDPATDKNNIAPRIGFAYDPTGSGKTAIRGGFGMAYGVKFQNFASITLPPQLQSELNPVSACTLTPQPLWCATFTGADGTGSGFLLNGGLPQTFLPPTTQAEARSLTTSFIDDTVMPKIMTWSLGVQHEVYRNAIVEVRYLGTRGLSLPVQYRRNFISAFDAGLAPLPTFFDPATVPTTWTASTPTDAPFNSFDPNIYSQFGFNGVVTSDPPFGSSTYHAASVNFTQRARWGLTLNTNYTFSHGLDNSTNEFFTSFLNPRRAQDTNRLSDDWSSSDLDVRHKFAISLIYQTPKMQPGNRFVSKLVNGYQIGSVFLLQSGQPVTLQSSNIDSNINFDVAGDRSSRNPLGVGNTGSDVFAVCGLPGGTTGLSNGGPGAFGTPTGVAAGGGCFSPADPTGSTFFPAIGYTPVNPAARYVVTGPGAASNVGRNSFYSPGFRVWNLSLGKDIPFTEQKYLQLRVDAFNILNHPNFALSNGNVFSNAGVTAATSTHGYVFPTDPNFLNAPAWFTGGIRSLTLGAKFIF